MNFQKSSSQKQISNPHRTSKSCESSQPRKSIFKSDQKPSYIETSSNIRNYQDEKIVKNAQIFEIEESEEINNASQIISNSDNNRKSQRSKSKTQTEKTNSSKQINKPKRATLISESLFLQFQPTIQSGSKNHQIETSPKIRNSQQVQIIDNNIQKVEQQDNINSSQIEPTKTQTEDKNSQRKKRYSKNNDQRKSRESNYSTQSNLIDTKTKNQPNIRKDPKASCVQVQCNVF